MPELHGQLKLRYAANADGYTFIRERFTNVPFHLSKPYWDGKVLNVQVVNPTAGILGGDQMRLDVVVEKNAAACLSTPSAARVHSMPGTGPGAVSRQIFHVETGGYLEFTPEILIPQANGRFVQSTQITLEPGAELFYVESLAPGRVAMGEILQFDQFHWTFQLRMDGALVVAENMDWRPQEHPWVLQVKDWPTCYYAGIWLVSGNIEMSRESLSPFENLTRSDALTGVSAFCPTGVCIKILARNRLSLNDALEEVRGISAKVLPRLQRHSRKI